MPFNPRPPSRLALVLGAAVTLGLASGLESMHTDGEFVLSWETLPVRAANHELGYCFQQPLGPIGLSSHERPSPAQLLEDGHLLGPGNSQHEDIRNVGHGRFSLWHDYLYFSASDSSDPRTNHKTYEIRFPTPINKRVSSALHLATLAFVLLSIILLAPALRRVRPSLIVGHLSQRLGQKLRGLAAGVPVVSFTLALSYLGILFAAPQFTLAATAHHIAALTLFVLCARLGYKSWSWRLNRSGDGMIRMAGRGLAFLLLCLFVLLTPAIGLQADELGSGLLALLISFFVGMLLRFFRTKFPHDALLPPVPPWCARIYQSNRLLLAIGASVLIALPGMVEPLASRWDNSGYMDSQMYDLLAHDIATGKVPEGTHFVMPLYQYGLALLYWTFGHFFYVQQITNVLFAAMAIVLLCLTAWNLFADYRAVLVAGVMSAFARPLHSFVYITQIENWYLPLIALTLFAWSCYWRRANLPHLVLLALTTGLTVNCRSQGAFYYALLIAAPWFVKGSSLRKRIGHFVLGGAIVGATLVPWSVRNYIYDKTFSPVTTQAEVSLVLNDHRIPFYGLRETNWIPYLEGYSKKYPETAKRLEVMRHDFFRNTFGDPIWLSGAVFWRGIAYYNLLPPGFWAPNGPEPTDWKTHWRNYGVAGFTSLFFIALGLLGLAMHPGRTTLFLALCICSHVVLVVAVPMLDPRYGYPVVPIHVVLGLFAFFPPAQRVLLPPGTSDQFHLFTRPRLRLFATAGAALLLFMLVGHLSYGKDNLERPLKEGAMLRDPGISPSASLPSLNEYYEWARYKVGGAPQFHVGDRVRFTGRVSNYMLPPKFAGQVPYLPAFASDPSREQYYYAFPNDSAPGFVGLTLFGATANTLIRENQLVDIEGPILYVDTTNTLLPAWYWMRAERVFLVNRATP
ncbi:MAG: hypothetical protein ABI672_12435 [Vicinamibacteria bacterium]